MHRGVGGKIDLMEAFTRYLPPCFIPQHLWALFFNLLAFTGSLIESDRLRNVLHSIVEGDSHSLENVRLVLVDKVMPWVERNNQIRGCYMESSASPVATKWHGLRYKNSEHSLEVNVVLTNSVQYCKACTLSMSLPARARRLTRVNIFAQVTLTLDTLFSICSPPTERWSQKNMRFPVPPVRTGSGKQTNLYPIQFGPFRRYTTPAPRPRCETALSP